LHFLAVGAIKFVMPANAGIQVRFFVRAQIRLDSGLRRNDGRRVTFRATKSPPRAC
jgi:hypothetical protein